MTPFERNQEIQMAVQAVRDPRYSKVIIVGGGYVGVETACSVAMVSNKPVVIYNRGEQICKELPEKARGEIVKKLSQFNIQVFCNRQLQPGEAEAEGAYKIDCTGSSCQPNKSLYSPEFRLDDKGCLLTGDYL